VNIYIGFWTLKPKCTQYGLYEQTAFKKCKGQAQVGGLSKSSDFLGAAPACLLPAACHDTWTTRRSGVFRETLMKPNSMTYMKEMQQDLVIMYVEWKGISHRNNCIIEKE
jgi:hypothetical protein